MGSSACAPAIESGCDPMVGATCSVLDDGLVHVGERGLWLPMGNAQRTRRGIGGIGIENSTE